MLQKEGDVFQAFDYGADLNRNTQSYFDVMVGNKAKTVFRNVSHTR